MAQKTHDFFTNLFNPHGTLAATATAIISFVLALASAVVALGHNGVEGLLHGDLPMKIWLVAMIILNIASTIRAGAGRGFMTTPIKPPNTDMVVTTITEETTPATK